MDFKENVVILTGASTGIGEALAHALAERGAWLVLAARNVERLEDVAAECRKRGGRVLVVATDVTDEGRCRKLIERAVAEYGRIDTLINNAGLSMWMKLEDVEDLSTLEYLMRVNFFGSMYCTYYALPWLKKTKGRIVAIASVAARTGVPTRTGYSASKHAMVGFFESLRIEVEDDGVSVTIAFPDFVASGMHTRSLGADGKPLGHNPLQVDKIMTSETCARLIIEGVAARKRQIVMSNRARFGQWLKLIAPDKVDGIAKRAIKEGR
ncbi:MAG: SDR family oxidoreductase [Candidatus Promineofilum sp.]|nr:SDR family oxidoreductase [Promineifilum sp.]MBP9657610.1 SDR family oxidoreductase [Promineifilum sp.]